MTKTANLRLQDITHKQIAELQEATGISTISGVIMMAVDRMYREECQAPPDIPIMPEYKEYMSICKAKGVEPKPHWLTHYLQFGEFIAD
jgi:hypothetical protein